MNQSCIYRGWVRHRRFQPQAHDFRYRLFMLYLDLAELPELFRPFWLWSADSRPALARFRRRDHLGDPGTPLMDAVRAIVREATGRESTGPIRLLTHLSYYGYCFNPISLYYCFNEAAHEVETIVAEVNNTPWGERHIYTLSEPQRRSPRSQKGEYWTSKAFHVSPFMKMDMEYRWRLPEPGRRLLAHIENRERDRLIFDATLNLSKQPLTQWNLTRCLLSFPFVTGKIFAAIHWQALRLYLKRIPFIPHPKYEAE